MDNFELENVSLLVISEILGLFLNTLTTDEKYSLRNSENLSESIKMQLSKTQKTFSGLLAAFLKSLSNFEHF